MTTNLPSFTILTFLLFISSIFSTSLSSGDLEWWCDQTPYPDPCKHSLTRLNPQPDSSLSSSSIPRGKFLKIVIELVMHQAITAQAHDIQLGPRCHLEKEMTAWTDCLTLYNDVVLHLNKTLMDTKCTDVDGQTWLSTALTDLDTCRDGFLELGISSSPLITNNHDDITRMLSNALAISNYDSRNIIDYDHNINILSVDQDGFPSWLTAGDRRLLQSEPPADLVVAKDGSGNFRTVKEAVAAAGERQRIGRFVIKIKSGIYVENVEIGNNLKNITLIGDGINRTVITAGPQNGQAVALRSGSDLSAFYRCSFEGYQDTLYVHSNRQFYRECSISGTVDFIFGNAATVLQNCTIYARRPMSGQGIMVTAQVIGSFKTYLGRPWKEYSRTVFMQTYLGSLVEPAGWSAWDGDFGLKTLYYGEYRNTGPGAPTGRRVKWARVITSADEAVRFSVGNFIAGRAWIPWTGIPFTVEL
ncbi:Probable pectinesterase/pectinesterase inhibitor 17 [Linum perenne]